MAETITYDPANDPVAIAESEARHTETLEQEAQKDSVEEVIVEPDTTVKDSTNN